MTLIEVRNTVVFSLAVLVLLAFFTLSLTAYGGSHSGAAGAATETATTTASETPEEPAIIGNWTA